MVINPRQLLRVSKRLTQAEGYLELGLPRQALARLDALGDIGPMAAAVEMLRGKAKWLQRRYDEAVESFRAAAERLDAPYDRPAWLALSVYYLQCGWTDEAIDTLARARGAHVSEWSP